MDNLESRAQRGDRQALAELVREHYAPVYRFCARRIGPEAAKDAAQETFVTMQNRVRNFSGKSSFQVWLFGIAHNHCRAIAKRSRQAPVQLESWFEAGESSEQEMVNRQALASGLGQLSQDHREAILLHEIEGLRYVEIAELLGIPEGTVKSRLHHAFARLRELMKEAV